MRFGFVCLYLCMATRPTPTFCTNINARSCSSSNYLCIFVYRRIIYFKAVPPLENVPFCFVDSCLHSLVMTNVNLAFPFQQSLEYAILNVNFLKDYHGLVLFTDLKALCFDFTSSQFNVWSLSVVVYFRRLSFEICNTFYRTGLFS